MKWIKHDTDANQDAKMQNVMLDYGLEGYGLYWYCIELIAGKVDKENITFELEHDARIIAKNTGSTSQKVEEMMRYFVKIGLFESSSGVITCLKLAKRLDKSMTSNAEMRAIIENLKSHDPVMIESCEPMQDKNRLDKTRLDKNKDIRENVFNEFWDTYGKKKDLTKCKAKFLSLSDADVNNIMAVVSAYVRSTPDTQFRKNPATWINGKCWLDDIDKPKTNNKNPIQGTDYFDNQEL